LTEVCLVEHKREWEYQLRAVLAVALSSLIRIGFFYLWSKEAGQYQVILQPVGDAFMAKLTRFNYSVKAPLNSNKVNFQVELFYYVVFCSTINKF